MRILRLYSDKGYNLKGNADIKYHDKNDIV